MRVTAAGASCQRVAGAEEEEEGGGVLVRPAFRFNFSRIPHRVIDGERKHDEAVEEFVEDEVYAEEFGYGDQTAIGRRGEKDN